MRLYILEFLKALIRNEGVQTTMGINLPYRGISVFNKVFNIP
jgi:hypothetical protein